jgi:hypothetical protein
VRQPFAEQQEPGLDRDRVGQDRRGPAVVSASPRWYADCGRLVPVA